MTDGKNKKQKQQVIPPKKRETREAKRAREVQADADKIEAELAVLLTDGIAQFQAENPGQEGYMYLEGMTIVVDTEKPEDEERIIHVVSGSN